MGEFEQLLARLEELLADVESLEPSLRDRVFELLDGVDEIHRVALHRLATLLGEERVNGLRQADPAVDWLLEAYGAGADQTADAEAALGSIRPYIESHGGRVEVIEAVGGVVRLRLSGACSGCTASAITLQRGVEEALREHMAGFLAMEVSEVEAAPHPPPGPTLLQVQPLAGRHAGTTPSPGDRSKSPPSPPGNAERSDHSLDLGHGDLHGPLRLS